MVPLRRTAGSDAWVREADELAAWLIGPARLSGDAAAVTSGFAQRLTTIGVPLHRLRIAMRVDNPLLTAWGMGHHLGAGDGGRDFHPQPCPPRYPYLCRQPGPACH
jgi:hypothetical protein